MALSVELLKRLNSDEEPLPKRLKLAENVFCTVDIPIVCKEDLTLQWLCKTCSKDKNAWISLKNCLKTTRLDVKVDVKKLLTNMLIAKLREDLENVPDNISECCQLLVSNDGMQQYFINEPKDLGLLIKSLLDYVLKLYKHTFNMEEQSSEGIDITLINKNSELILITYNMIINILESILQIFNSAFTTRDTLKNTFIHDILYSLCTIIDHKCTNNTNKLRIVAHKCVQQLIFGRKDVCLNEMFLEHENTHQFADLLSALTENAKMKNLQSNLMTFVFIFRVATGVFKSNSTVLDLILRELVECAGIHGKQILNSLLKNMNDVTFDFNNKIHGVTLFEYCQNTIDSILLSESMSNVDYDLLSQFCYFNPLIIEKRMQDILRKIFVGNPTLEYTNLMIAIQNANVHLRQEEKLVSAILIALKHSLHQVSNITPNMFFPQEFKNMFLKSVNNITILQGLSMLRTLIYHLENDCMEVLQSNDTCKNISIMQATVELLVTLLDGLSIYEYTETLTSHKKFINALDDLGNILSLLTDKILHLNYNKKINTILLSAIFSWNEIQKALKYYVPKAATRDLRFPVSEVQWQQLIQRITNFGKDSCKTSMNKLILQRIKMSKNTINESFIKLNCLIGGLEYSWPSILKLDTEVISLLTNKDLSKVTYLLLTDITSSVDNFCEWIKVLRKDSLQGNKKFIISFLSCVITQITYLTTEGVTKSICEHYVTKTLLEDTSVENQEINEILMSMKEEFLKDKWKQIDSASLCKIKVHLEILLHIPLMFLNTNIRSVTFMIVFALRKECDQNDEIISLCNIIFSDLLEMPGLNMFQYIEPSLLLGQLPQNRNVQKAMELFFKNSLSYTMLKTLIKSSIHTKKNLYFLLECMEHVKPKLNIDQKAIVRKAEKKLSKIIIKTLPSNITETDDVKILSIILKMSISNENIDEKLKNVVELILYDIFLNDADKNNKLLKDGLQLTVVVFRNRKIFQVTNQIVKSIWNALLKFPCTDVLLPLLESSEPQEFHEFLEYLHSHMVKIISNVQENNLKNICIIWNAILKLNMSSNRNKLRLSAIDKLIQTIQIISISNKLWPSLLKLIQSILVTKHLYLSGHVIDMTIFLTLKSLQETTIMTCNDALILCNTLLKMRTGLVTDRLPILLVLYKRILNIVVHNSKAIINKSEDHMFKCLAFDAEKFMSSLVKLKKDMIRLSPYLIADLLELFSEDSIATCVKVSLQKCINLLISICDQHGIALLSRTLPISMQEIFKTQLDVFNKFYKFYGKI